MAGVWLRLPLKINLTKIVERWRDPSLISIISSKTSKRDGMLISMITEHHLALFRFYTSYRQFSGILFFFFTFCRNYNSPSLSKKIHFADFTMYRLDCDLTLYWKTILTLVHVLRKITIWCTRMFIKVKLFWETISLSP